MWRTGNKTIDPPRFGPKELPETPSDLKTQEPDEDSLEQTTTKQVIVPEFIDIEKMSVRYIQPIPVPNFIEFLQHLKHKDVDFVKIPINKKDDALYLRKPISKLFGNLTGIHWDKISMMITQYN